MRTEYAAVPPLTIDAERGTVPRTTSAGAARMTRTLFATSVRAGADAVE